MMMMMMMMILTLRQYAKKVLYNIT